MRNTLPIIALLLLCTAVSYSQAPVNDECSGAVDASVLPYTNTQNTRVATPNASDPILICADSGGGKTVWYKYTADSTTYVTFSSAGSTPATYDVAMGLYTGSCGSLVEVECNDDINPGSVRQAEITFMVSSGTTYYIQIAEWNGGGPSGGVPTGGDLLFRVFYDTLKPLIAPPKFGMTLTTATVSTNDFGIAPSAGDEPEMREPEEAAENEEVVLLPPPDDVKKPLAPLGSNYYEDKGAARLQQSSTSRPIVFKSFQGNTATGAIPPDPILAVGPNHVVGAVNSSFTIWDKNGTLLKSISFNAWFNSVKNPVGFSDPQVLYDHYANRWILGGGGFDDVGSPYSLLVAVSDDDDPIGDWHIWSLPSGMGDSITGALPDYPQMGYDEQAIYITTREFNPGFQYSRCRIIPKVDLYEALPDTVRWTDIYDFREPDHRTIPLDGIRPSIEYDSPGVHFLVNAAPYNPGTFFTVWKIENPLSASPTVSADNVPVVEYLSAPNASQPGGGTAFEGGGSVIRHKAVYRDSSLFMVHQIATGTGNAYSGLQYVKLNPYTYSNEEDMSMGVEGFWHFYPALMVDGEKNVILTYTRSGTSEYAGAFISGRRASDPPGFSPSVPLKAGVAHYDVTASGRNRWGDYMGAALDPVDSLSVWVNTEYVPSTDVWRTWIGKIKMGPLPGAFIFSEQTSYTFASTEVGDTTSTQNLVLTNNGLDSLVISAITLPDSHFMITNMPSFPLTLASFEAETLKLAFTPETRGTFSDVISIASNDSVNPSYEIAVSGPGFIIDQAEAGKIYAGTNSIDNGRIHTLVDTTGAATPIGQSGYVMVANLKVRPSTGELMGLVATSDNPASVTLARINSSLADAHPVKTFSLTFAHGLALKDDTFYVARITGQIYRLNEATGTTTLVASTGGKAIAGMDFNPITGQLWFSVRNGTLDQIYKMNFPSGPPVLVGRTGFNVSTVDIAFDAAGHLFGIIGSNTVPNELIVIDTTVGYGQIIGPLGVFGCQALAIPPGTTLPVPPFGVFEYELASRWNLLSVPLLIDDYSAMNLFPTATSRAYTYMAGYVSKDTLENGLGYWVRFDDSTTTSVTKSGIPIPEDSVNVVDKWNILGSLSTPIPTTKVTPVPPLNIVSSFYGYADTGYFIADTIRPGKAYWAKVDRPGKVVFKTTGAASKSTTVSDVRDYLSSMNSLTLRSADGRAQTLYMGSQPQKEIAGLLLELPPPPPTGVFDARWSSNTLAEVHPALMSGHREFSISVRSAHTPMQVEWNTSRTPGIAYSLVAFGPDGSTLLSRRLSGRGNMSLTAATLHDLRLRVENETTPMEFALRQNFPNPFNPTTTIRYDLPQAEFVSVAVFDLLGRKVMTLVSERQEAGYHAIEFSADNLASGLYFYKLTAGSYTDIKKMMLLR